MNKYAILGILMVMLGNVLVWFQVNGQLVWKSFHANTLALCALGMPIAYVFIKATEYGYQGFDDKIWPFRIVSMAIGIIIFTLMAGVFMNEIPDFKTIVALSLCVVAILVQILL